MTDRTCPRRWEAEAIRDGRLSGDPVESFEQHTESCAECREEQRALEGLSKAISSLMSEPDEVSLRRLRQHTLEEADALLREPRRRRSLPIPLVAALTLIALTLGTFALVTRSKAPEPTMVASSDAKWSRRVVSGAPYIDLADGVLRVTVHRGPSDARLVVHVPDGDIEDMGTVFVVAVSAGRTSEIAVTEGVVVFRRPGLSNVVISAGGRWAAPTPTADPARAPSAQVENEGSVRPPELAKPVEHAEVRAGAARREGSGPRRPELAADRRDEDRAYLRIVALLREGRTEEARGAAQDYVSRFPHGFRRAEVDGVLEHSASAATTPGK